jgi:hypothetical protein
MRLLNVTSPRDWGRSPGAASVRRPNERLNLTRPLRGRAG